MRKAKNAITCAILGLSGLGLSALAEIPDVDQPLDAKIIETNPDASTITVQFEANDSVETLKVAEDAEFVRIAPNNIERRIALSDVNPGTEVDLEYEDVAGEPTLLIITIREL